MDSLKEIANPLKCLFNVVADKKPVSQLLKAAVLLSSLWVGAKAMKTSWNLLSFLAETFIPGPDLKRRYGKDSWALVTGASDGLGRAFAIELGREGLNVIIVGDNFEKLLEINNYLAKTRAKPQTKIIVMDLTQVHNEGYLEEAFKDIKDLDVSIIVNAAHRSISGNFNKYTEDDIRKALTINTIAPFLITSFFANKMNLREKRSAVINIAAMGEIIPSFAPKLPLTPKSFLSAFTHITVPKFSSKIDFLTYKPTFFVDDINENKENLLSVPYQKTAMSCLDMLGRRKETFGHWKHRLLSPLYRDYAWFRIFANWVAVNTSRERRPNVYIPKKGSYSNKDGHNYQ